LISDKIIRKKMGENAYTRVRSKFSKLDIQYIENLYQEILGV